MILPGDEIDDRSHYPTSTGALRELGLVPVNAERHPPLLWIDGFITMETAEALLPYQRANKIPCMDYLCFKSTIFTELNKARKKYPSAFNFYTPTYVLPDNFPEFQRMHSSICSRNNEAPTWVIKPKNGSCGKGIILINSTHEAEEVQDHSVAQLYIHPYLLDNLKFDFRFFVLVASLDSLTVFVYKEGIARFCTEPYSPPSKQNKNHQFCHLTNTAVNKMSNKNPEDFTRLATEVLKRFGANEKIIWEKVKRLSALAIAGLYPAIMATLPKYVEPKVESKTLFKPKTARDNKAMKSSISKRRSLSPTREMMPKKVPGQSLKILPALNEEEEEAATEKTVVKEEPKVELKLPEETANKESTEKDNEDIVSTSRTSEEKFQLKEIRNTIPRKFFHILGIDVMIDENMEPQFLELNDRPSLSVTVPFEMPLKKTMIMDSFKHVTHDGAVTNIEAEGSGWEIAYPSKDHELNSQVALAMTRKSDLKYSGYMPGKGATAMRIVDSGIKKEWQKEHRARFEDLRQSMKAPKFVHYTKVIL
ncbi:Tubulin-tyrosine ligase family protein [Trichomonas vaginalis G3]|uniref:Tubulin-tyrosine ligase family protein n=1 Tax=Trichomonas vaginalis (strain ATCC PRA-98 / G3) TaxID=412133 RepID=A2EK98_TRIV3|nr:positive regulation of cilium movement [Trichomonas vaginalis G3]EAY06896.1 Tubulin-tyrosine ligase family protein [Trichomonas vaginalis G3]KAI5513943.1 positive regulation of cilium movement [Trichomonas vaginalis G3]|eukprot:XP_001319119.1 Tubulin-tyrosine ligase family protein [Trichomonas vaginalis G3]